MSGPEPEALETWATNHGLTWQEEDTVPPVTERLRLGLGVGEHRPSFRSVSDSGVVSTTGSNRKRPERQTLGVCEGMLPGGLSGRLAHHVHVSDQGRGQEDRYIAHTDTIVYAELPLRARPAFHLEGGPASKVEVKGGIRIGGKDGGTLESPLHGVVPAPQGTAEVGGMKWTSFPAESEERVRHIASSATRFLDGLPTDRIAVEYECGVLAVWVKGRVLTEEASLSGLCRFASQLARDLELVVESTPDLDLAQPLPMLEPDARTLWVEDGADLVDWDEPPVSIVAAQERYKKDVKPHAARTGWTVYGIVATALFLLGVLVALASLATSFLTDQLPLGLGLMIAAVSIAGGALAANRVALGAGQEVMDDRVSSSATPWGIEAFARGYAEHAGLAREDHDELRRRLEVPFNGRPQIAWQGELAAGLPGHLSIWIDATNSPDPPCFYLLAVTAPTGGETPAGYQSEERNGQRLTWQEVTSVQRATHRLDQLREAATK
ncbi:MAG: hypothetical protein QG596_1685 [Actinomycetota bacterium]|jgi:hypothetical protein|nr:hypothetical protein [Actinomycetota bacterium]